MLVIFLQFDVFHQKLYFDTPALELEFEGDMNNRIKTFRLYNYSYTSISVSITSSILYGHLWSLILILIFLGVLFSKISMSMESLCNQ